jgi:hypothetical protein
MSATRFRGAEKGASLVLVLMFATTIASFCLFSLASSQAVYKTAKTGLETTKAFYLAEGGIDYALSQLSQDPYWAAASATDLPVEVADGSFESDWLELGNGAGVYKINVAYATANKLPAEWTGTGFPSGFVPYANVAFASRTSAPPFDRILVTSTGRYNGVTKSVRANIKSQVLIYSGAIISDAPSITGNGKGKAWSQSNQTLVMDGMHQYVYGGIRTNGGAYMNGSTTPLTEANASLELTAFTGDFKANLAGTTEEVPDYTDPGSTTQLFDFGRFKAAADAGAGASYASVADFEAAMNAANVAGKPLEGVIYVTVDASKPNPMNIPDGINVNGTLAFHFINAADSSYKLHLDMPVRINPAAMPDFDAENPSTFATGYPAVLPAAKDPRNVDITSAGYKNFAADDDFPALVFDNGTVVIQNEANICGVTYGPAFIEIENKFQKVQYFRGSVIGGGGIYLEGRDNSTNYHQVFVYDPNTLDSLATFSNEAKTLVISSYVVNQ